MCCALATSIKEVCLRMVTVSLPLLGIVLAHGVGSPGVGAGVGIGFYVAVSAVAVFIAKTPEIVAPSSWNKSTISRKFWYLAFYSGNPIRRDLNLIVGQGSNWKIPAFLPFLLRYISGPVLMIIFSFAYPEFHTLRYDPMMIAGFILSQIAMAAIIIGFTVPRYYDAFVPLERRHEGTESTVAMETKGEVAGVLIKAEDGSSTPFSTSQEQVGKDV